MNPSLETLFQKYASYDIAIGTDKSTIHSYSKLYESILSPVKDSIKNVLEIGVFSGASCQVWSEYLTGAQIYGLDIDFRNLIYGIQNPKIKYLQLDGTKSECLKFLPEHFDFVLDDGSHRPYDQIQSAKLFVPKTDIYICEDINSLYMDELKREFNHIAEINSKTLFWHDLRDVKSRFDDIVAVIK